MQTYIRWEMVNFCQRESNLPSDIRSARAGGPGDHARADRSGSGECTDSEWNFVSRAYLSMQRDDPADHSE